MKEDNLEYLFAAVRRTGSAEFTVAPVGYAESVLRRHEHCVQESQVFFRTSILSIATAFVILGAILGINMGSNGSPGSADQEPTDEMAYALWDPAGN
jgi:hypothetical protein